MSDAFEEGEYHFATNKIKIYHGPLVNISIQPSSLEYIVSIPLLCAESPVFSAMLNNKPGESQEQKITLQEMEVVLSARSVKALIQWLYLRVVDFPLSETESVADSISAGIELARLADKYGIVDINYDLTRYIKDIITSCICEPVLNDDPNTYWLDNTHIIAATSLPRGHSVRHLLAKASVHGFLKSKSYKFARIAQKYPSFAADLLREVGCALTGVEDANSGTYMDPLTKKKDKIRPQEQALS